jgi:hypothetical protein
MRDSLSREINELDPRASEDEPVRIGTSGSHAIPGAYLMEERGILKNL